VLAASRDQGPGFGTVRCGRKLGIHHRLETRSKALKINKLQFQISLNVFPTAEFAKARSRIGYFSSHFVFITLRLARGLPSMVTEAMKRLKEKIVCAADVQQVLRVVAVVPLSGFQKGAKQPSSLTYQTPSPTIPADDRPDHFALPHS
jgi:hypothetical protein